MAGTLIVAGGGVTVSLEELSPLQEANDNNESKGIAKLKNGLFLINLVFNWWNFCIKMIKV